MDVGMMMVFASYGWENCSDKRVWDEEIRLARLAAELGFDCLWSAEHHFADYSFVPDNIQLMTYMTGICPDIDIGTAAVILPWHDFHNRQTRRFNASTTSTTWSSPTAAHSRRCMPVISR